MEDSILKKTLVLMLPVMDAFLVSGGKSDTIKCGKIALEDKLRYS